MKISLEPVTKENWRDVCNLKVKKDQREFVADPSYYLNLCHYGKVWNPLAIYNEKKVIGFLMWAIDSQDNSCWLGGIIIDALEQSKGFGKKALELTMEKLSKEQKVQDFALSYSPSNPAKNLYKKLGFNESGEMEEEEMVARLHRNS